MNQLAGGHHPAQVSSFSYPRSLPACFPWIWSRVLFPSHPAVSTDPKWRSILLLLILPAALIYPCLGFHLFEPDEGRYAEIPREMLIRGEWVVPFLQSEPYLDKPPLLYWLVVLSYRVFGVADWSARLVPALAVHLCVLLTYWIGRRSLGERAAFWGALLLALAPGFATIGRLLVLDGLLTLWVTLSILSAFEAVRGERLRRSWWLLAAVACGLGVLTKGPVAVVLLVPPIVLHQWLMGRSQRISWLAWIVFAGIVLLVPLPWYIAICVRAPAFAYHFFWEHNIVRFLAPFDHLQPIGYYVPLLLVGLLPGTMLAFSFVRFLLTNDPASVERRSPELGFMLLAGGWCVLFFSLSGCKLPTYIMPAFPFLTLTLGSYLAGSRWMQTSWPAVCSGAAVLTLGIGHFLALPWYAEYRSPLRWPAEVTRLCGDPKTPVICYPRNCDSVAFYLGRDDLRNYRSKQTPNLIRFMQKQPRTVILFTHRHSLEALRQVLPPDLRIHFETPLCASAKPGPEGLCFLAVVQRCRP